MKISVLIPAFNSSKTIEASLETVFAQTVPADEVIVLLDGGNDDTEARLAKFGDRIRLLKQENTGVAIARNRLVVQATGDMVAFLDADDLWHPKYLEVQRAMFIKHPEAVASFTGHTRFEGADFSWSKAPEFNPAETQVLDSVAFFAAYNVTTAIFGSMSYMCVLRKSFEQIGVEPFTTDLNAVEDSYLCYRLALLGPVLLNLTPFVAYRMTQGSLSVNRVRNVGLWVRAFERLEPLYLNQKSKPLSTIFSKYYAQKRREYSKLLMGVDRVAEARAQLWCSLRNCRSPESIVKALAWLVMGAMPRSLQPAWPSSVRKSGPAHG